MAQRERIIKYMEQKGSITHRQAIYLGCYSLPQRIYDMKHEVPPVPIDVEMNKVKSTDGATAMIASYSLGKDYPKYLEMIKERDNAGKESK